MGPHLLPLRVCWCSAAHDDLRAALATAGCRLLGGRAGEEPADVVVLDSGEALLRWRAAQPHAALVVLAAPADEVRLLAAGADAVLDPASHLLVLLARLRRLARPGATRWAA